MRLWHYELIPYLPKSQLLAQWRELNSIFKKQDKHILINYVYEYPKDDLLLYANMVIEEMGYRSYEIKSFNNYYEYFMYTPVNIPIDGSKTPPFKSHHNKRYLMQCFLNLQEKYDRGQKDFSQEEYERLACFVEYQICNYVVI